MSLHPVLIHDLPHRSYLVLTAGFYFAPPAGVDEELENLASVQEFPSLSLLQSARWYLSWWFL